MEIFVPNLMYRKYIDFKDPISAGIGMSGEFGFTVRRKGIITQDVRFHNIITDYGLRKIAATVDSFYNIFKYFYLGTGSAVPVSTDVKLQTYLANKQYSATGSGTVTTTDKYYEMRVTFGLSEANGNLTEVGMGDTNNPATYNLFNRALIADGSGNPITIVKTSEDTMDAFFRLHFRRLSDTPTTSVVTVAGVGDITVETLLLNNGIDTLAQYAIFNRQDLGNSGIGTNTGALSPTLTDVRNLMSRSSLTIYPAYVAGTQYRDITEEWPINPGGNVAEMVSGFSWNMRQYMHRFTPVIPKDTTKKFRATTRVTYNRV